MERIDLHTHTLASDGSDAPADVVRKAAALGLRGIKLHPEYQGFFVDDPACAAVVRKASALGLWVVFHAGADIGMPPPIHCTPERVIRLRQDAPDAKILLAHLGGYRVWEEVLAAMPAMGAAIDTSFCIAGHPERCAAGVSRVFFGTASPWEDQAASLDATRRFLAASGFSREETAAILGGNAARELGIA